MNEFTALEEVRGAGAAQRVTAEQLVEFKQEMDYIAKQAGATVNERRTTAEEVRFTQWDAQSKDGRKHADANAGRPVEPYEGASDMRIRLADMITGERVLVLVAAAMRGLAALKCAGMEIHDEALGGRLTTVWKWVFENKMGRRAVRRELKKLANYQESDSPAVGILGVFWKQEAQMVLEEVTLQELAEYMVQEYGLPLEVVSEAMKTIRDPELEASAAEWLRDVLGEWMGLEGFSREGGEGSEGRDGTSVRPQGAGEKGGKGDFDEATCLGIVRDLRNGEVAEFPRRVWVKNHPEWVALRLMDDIFLPINTPSDIQRARCLFHREWLSRAELEEREFSLKYSRKFIEEVLKHEGQTGFPIYKRTGVAGDASLDTQAAENDPESHKGEYEVVTTYHKAVNAEGVPGIYTVVFSYHVEFAAKERELFDYKHGKYPYVEFPREVLNNRLTDSRSVPELVMTDQMQLKLLNDALNDNVEIASLPPFEVPMSRKGMRLVIGPLKKVPMLRSGEIRPMEMPAYPGGNEKQQDSTQRRVNQYFGRIAEDVMPLLTQLHQQGLADDFLDNLGEAASQTIALCQQFMEDDELQLVTGALQRVPVARSVEEIQGEYHVRMEFAVGMMDMAFVKELAEVIGSTILPIDTLSTVQRDRLVQFLFQAINPNLAEETLRPVEESNLKEIEDEQNNFTKISAGVEPPMMPQGQNYELRLSVNEEIATKNPEAIEKLTPMSRKIWQARIEHLQNMVEQTKVNPGIGRAVGKPVLGS